jgi:glycosyltransferase involved in cell wall biosynthesis
MEDITIVMLIANKVPESWAKFHREKLEEVMGDTPIITVSYKPLDWGMNLIQTVYSNPNIFVQMLRAFKLATTKWVAMADDDTLYPPGHFQFRGTEDGFFYNYHRWQIASWHPHFYYHKPKPGNGCMIASRELAIHYLEERFKKSPLLNGHNECKELGTWNRWTGFKEPNHHQFNTEYGIVTLDHDYSHDRASQRHTKILHPIRAIEIPRWGKSVDIAKKFV